MILRKSPSSGSRWALLLSKRTPFGKSFIESVSDIPLPQDSFPLIEPRFFF